MPTLERSLKTKPNLMTDMIPLRKEQASEFSMKKFCFACLHGGAAKLAAATFIIGLSLGAAEADQAGGKFGFPYPNFTGSAGGMTAQQFVRTFDAAMQTPSVFRDWIQAGTDIRKLNPSGVYLKHINLRTIDSTARQKDTPTTTGFTKTILNGFCAMRIGTQSRYFSPDGRIARLRERRLPGLGSEHVDAQ